MRWSLPSEVDHGSQSASVYSECLDGLEPLILPQLPPCPADLAGGLMRPRSTAAGVAPRPSSPMGNGRAAGSTPGGLSDEGGNPSQAVLQDVLSVFPLWPQSGGNITILREHIQQIIYGLNWSNERICMMLTYIIQQVAVDIEASDAVLEQMYTALLSTRNSKALKYMLFLTNAEPLTKKAMNSAMRRLAQNVPLPNNRYQEDAWSPYYLARLDCKDSMGVKQTARDETPCTYIYIQQIPASRPGLAPAAIRMFYGTPKNMKPVKLTQRIEQINPAVPNLSSAVALNLDAPNMNLNRQTVFYIDSEVGQMFIDHHRMGDQGMLSRAAVTKTQADASLAEQGPLYQAKRHQSFFTGTTVNRFRTPEGEKFNMTVIGFTGSYEEELMDWVHCAPINPWTNDMPLQFDGMTIDDIL